MTDLFTATLAGIDIDCVSADGTRDELSKSIVKHEFPHRDGALLEDMGQHGRVVRLTAKFAGDDYPRHQDLIDALGASDTYELVHPIYGVLVGSIEQLSIRNDDRIEYAEVDIVFLEDLIGSTEESLADVTDVEFETQESFLQGIADQAAALSEEIAADMQTFSNTVSLASYRAELESCIRSGEAILTSVAQPANSLLTTVTFATDLPGRILGAVANTVERYSVLYDATRNAPARFVASFRNGLAQLEAALPKNSMNPARRLAQDLFRRHAQIAGACRLGLELGSLYKADEAARSAEKEAEKQQSFDASGKYLFPTPLDPIMTITDIERSLADARTEIQTAVDASRGIQSLKDLAAALLSHVDRVKLEREKIMTVTIENMLPLHLIMMKYGHPYNTAERVLAINPQVKNPSFVAGDIKIYV